MLLLSVRSRAPSKVDVKLEEFVILILTMFSAGTCEGVSSVIRCVVRTIRC